MLCRLPGEQDAPGGFPHLQSSWGDGTAWGEHVEGWHLDPLEPPQVPWL